VRKLYILLSENILFVIVDMIFMDELTINKRIRHYILSIWKIQWKLTSCCIPRSWWTNNVILGRKNSRPWLTHSSASGTLLLTKA